MRRLVVLGVLAAVLTAAPAVAGRVGFVEVERAAATVAEGRIALEGLQAWNVTREKALQALEDRARELQQQLQRQRGVATDEARERLERDAVGAQRAFEDAVREYQREYEQRQNAALREVALKLNTVISDYAKANDYDAVLIFKPLTIIYLSETSDLTDTVIRLYDERFPVR